MRDAGIDLSSFSIIDLIESPVQELSNIFASLTEEQRKLCWCEDNRWEVKHFKIEFSRNIRKKERSCSTVDDNVEDRLLPPDDPSEIQYQFLKGVLQNKF